MQRYEHFLILCVGKSLKYNFDEKKHKKNVMLSITDGMTVIKCSNIKCDYY